VAWQYDFPGTVELALRWHPQARRLAVVTGTAPWDRDWETLARAQAKALDASLEVEFLAGLPAAALKQRLGQLGNDTVVFTPGYFRDGDGRLTVPREAARLIAAATNAPVYGPFPTFVGTGLVGGVMASYVSMGRMAAEGALALLANAAPAAVALPKIMPNQVHVDWRQVRRFGIDAEAVPADAAVSFKEPSSWEAYGHFVLIAGAVILVQSALLATLLLERRRRRRTASALAQSEQRMNLAAQAARLSMWSWDIDRRQVPVRAPARRSTDHLPDAFTDFKDVLASIDPQDRATVQQAVDRALASGEEMNVEFRVGAPEGQTRWMAARGRAAMGGSPQLLGVALDITPRKRAEEQAEQDRGALRHMTRVSLLGQLSASIAHQLNQPLASILSNAEAAQKMLQRTPVDLAELREICDDIVAEDHRAAEVIRRLGALFKRGEPTLLPLDINELVHDTLDLARTNLLTRHVRLTTELASDLPPVDGDRVQLQQLLLNLIVNAADAMDATPQAERLLTLSTTLADGHVAMCVADRGTGIARANRDKVYEPFWSSKDGGMGMGLAICRSIAEAHRGELSARNAPEGGAVFCVRLPVSPSS
jgi:C4-dicarboxylate-specific signal transduction histidine kinase